jgi:putative transposase
VRSVASNLLERQFQATVSNQKWAADFTYVWTAESWLFVAVVLDLYSRRVMGWSMQPTMIAQLVIICGMSRRGNCWDNAAMENFFSTLKTERLSRRQYRTRNELRADIFDYIERFRKVP